MKPRISDVGRKRFRKNIKNIMTANAIKTETVTLAVSDGTTLPAYVARPDAESRDIRA